jgi:UDP-N-acetylmuramate dehydrogenase
MSDIARAEAILRAACGDRVRTAFPMAPLTSFRIGGPAALYLEPESESDLAAASQALAAGRLPHVVIGKGSNVLVSDRGFQGLVLRLGRAYRWAARDGNRLSAGGSMPLPALSGVALHHALDGLAFGVAIPASLGGAGKRRRSSTSNCCAAATRRCASFITCSTPRPMRWFVRQRRPASA